jgi:DNA-binding MarR family transcriptional regulator
MKKAGRAHSLNLSWDEIGFLCEGMSLASRPMGLAVKAISEEYSLGPRGAWITVLIAAKQVSFPLDLTNVFQIGRSLITAELTRLTEAGLIAYGKSASDGRRVELKLTPLGDSVQRRVKEELSKLVLERLSSYKREDVLVCARMLRDFRLPIPGSVGSGRPEDPSVVPTASRAQHARGEASGEKRRQPAKRAAASASGRRSKQAP